MFAAYNVVCFLIAFAIPWLTASINRKMVHAICLTLGGLGLFRRCLRRSVFSDSRNGRCRHRVGFDPVNAVCHSRGRDQTGKNGRLYGRFQSVYRHPADRYVVSRAANLRRSSRRKTFERRDPRRDFDDHRRAQRPDRQ